MADLSEKFRRIFQRYKIQVNFRSGQTLKHRLVHPKDKTSRHKLSNVCMLFNAQRSALTFIQGKSKSTSTDTQHNTGKPPHQDRTQLYHCILRRKGTPLRTPMSTFWTEKTWFERGVKEAIDVHLEKSSPNRGGGQRHHLSATYNAILGALPLVV